MSIHGAFDLLGGEIEGILHIPKEKAFAEAFGAITTQVHIETSEMQSLPPMYIHIPSQPFSVHHSWFINIPSILLTRPMLLHRS